MPLAAMGSSAASRPASVRRLRGADGPQGDLSHHAPRFALVATDDAQGPEELGTAEQEPRASLRLGRVHDGIGVPGVPRHRGTTAGNECRQQREAIAIVIVERGCDGGDVQTRNERLGRITMPTAQASCAHADTMKKSP
jgi:hypothetical protein